MFHKHKWIAVACDASFEREFYNAADRVAKMPITQVLLRCKCGEVNTRQVDGRWTPADLGVDAKTVKDLQNMLNELN